MSEPAPIMMADITDVVGAHYGVSLVALRSTRRTKDLVEPRHVACFVGTKITSHSLLQIGAFLRRDHSTILHGRDKIADAIRRDRELAERVEAIELAATAMAQLRYEQKLSRPEPLTPLELAQLVSERGARAACGISVNQVLELCEAVIETSNRPPPPPDSRYLIVDLVAAQLFFKERPTSANEKARDEAVDPLRNPDRRRDALVDDIVEAFDAMKQSQFTMAEKATTDQFNQIILRAKNWLKIIATDGETE